MPVDREISQKSIFGKQKHVVFGKFLGKRPFSLHFWEVFGEMGVFLGNFWESILFPRKGQLLNEEQKLQRKM